MDRTTGRRELQFHKPATISRQDVSIACAVPPVGHDASPEGLMGGAEGLFETPGLRILATIWKTAGQSWAIVQRTRSKLVSGGWWWVSPTVS